MPRIEPTVGRVLLYHDPRGHTNGSAAPEGLAAQIAAVNEDGTVNVGILDRDGHQFCRQNLPLVQDGDEKPGGNEPYLRWMDYQRGQAAKTEEAERKLAEQTKGEDKPEGGGDPDAEGDDAEGDEPKKKKKRGQH